MSIIHLGIGTAHAPGTPTTDSLTSALKHTLQPDVTTRALRLSWSAAQISKYRPLLLELFEVSRLR
jgi:hypothetical protein